MAPASDEQLVRECLAGSEAAWATLIGKYQKLIYSIPVKYRLSVDEATDVFQDTCVELLSELPRLREPRALPRWLIQITSHKCLRRKAQQQRIDLTGDTRFQDETADTASPSDQVLLEVERDQAVRDALSDLPPRCQRLMQLLFFETPPRPYRQVADMMNVASGSVGFIRGRCLDRLRSNLKRQGFG
jgi:RNA polymerase sigma factor (sigma-70 family)